MPNLIFLQKYCNACKVSSEIPGKIEPFVELGVLLRGEPVIILHEPVGTGWKYNCAYCLTRYGVCQIHRDYLRTAF